VYNFWLDGINFYKNNPLILIAGPCAIEGEVHCLFMAKTLKKIAEKLHIPFIFKSSYSKANRTKLTSFNGVGLDRGLQILSRVRDLGIPVLSDVHSIEEVRPAGEVLDIIQIPAFLCRQTDLIISAAETGKIINIKKGQFLSPCDMEHAILKARSVTNKILVTERGSTFGYNNLVVDMRSLAILNEYDVPVVFDATHSVQHPGCGGDKEFVEPLSKAAAAVGINALFVEVHDNPGEALCDGDNMITPTELEDMLPEIISIDNIVKVKKSVTSKRRK